MKWGVGALSALVFRRLVTRPASVFRELANTSFRDGSAKNAGLTRRSSVASTRTPEAESLLTPAEVATMFRVDPKTVTRWAKAGKLTSIRTLGGHRRYRETEVRALLGGIPLQRDGG
jgi:excisionase family DNA binding protein